MFENRRRLYISLISFSSHTIAIISFLSILYYFQSHETLPYYKGTLCILPGTITTIATLLIGVTITNILLINYFYSSQHQFYLPQPKTHIVNYLVIAFADISVAYIMQGFLQTKVLIHNFYVYFYIVAVILNIVATYAIFTILKIINAWPRNRRNFVMIGSNERAVQFSKFIENNTVLGFYNIGFLDDANYSGEEIKMLGNLEQFSKIIRDNVVDCVVVYLPIRSCYDQIVEIIGTAEIHGIAVHYFTNIFNPKHSSVMTSRFGALASIVMHSAPLEDWRILLKRLFDFVSSLTAIIILSPLMLVVAIIIKLSDKGNILYSQERVGYNKRIFKLYKFRTMCMNADKIQNQFTHLNEMDGPVFKIKNDPRIIPIGHFLRKYSIDELPQLFNVLKGDMSVVGPRPMALRDYEGFSEDWQRRRFSMRPGLTCYWQIRGRNTVTFETWMRLDMEYIDNWNLLEDLRIIFLTIPEVLKGGGV